jgi:hypothetical protein
MAILADRWSCLAPLSWLSGATAISVACPAASLLTATPILSGRTCTSKRSFETSHRQTHHAPSSPIASCDCGREPQQLFGREMTDSAGALLKTGENPMLAYSRGAAAARTLGAARAAPRTMPDGAETRLLRCARNDTVNGCHCEERSDEAISAAAR